jgi:filamentous hemagglutinin family protein
MNNTYRLIWNELANTWVAVAENAKSRGKRSAGALLLTAAASVAMAQTVSTQQLPTGGQIVSGSGAISTQGAAMTVSQNTARMISNWSSFNIGANASVQFVQPSASAVALNRIQSQDPTQIMGRLTANGQVMLVNPAGVVFGRGSQVDVGSLVASSLAISDANFLNGNYRFAADGLTALGAVVNQGRITTANGGSVAFLAPVVKNEGQITTPKGSTLLGAAQDITVDFAGDGLIGYRVNAGAASALVENTGTVMADGGMAVLSAQSVDSITQGVVNNTGLVRAQRLESRDGRIVLEGKSVTQAGELTASAIGARAGGRFEQTATGVMNADSDLAASGGTVRVDAGADVVLSGRVSANGSAGGHITLAAPEVSVLGATLQAMGQAAQAGDGGTIRIGGGYQGKDTDIANAERTRVLDSTLDVSATQNGNAGTAIVWSEQQTIFNSTANAKGGAQGGNGGLVEVSSHDQLGFSGRVNASAPKGVGGSLLLDPSDITIGYTTSGVALGNPTTAFATSPGTASSISYADIESILSAGTALTLQANNNITVAANIDIPTASGLSGPTPNPGFSTGDLTLQAGKSITVNPGVMIDVLNANLTLRANDAGAVSANRSAGNALITLNGSTLRAGTGTIDISMGSGVNASATTGGIALTSGLTKAANVIVSHNGTSGTGIDISGAVIDTDAGQQNAGSLVISANQGGITSSTSSLILRGNDGNTVTMRARDDISLSTNTLNRIGSASTIGATQLYAGRSVSLSGGIDLLLGNSPMTIRANYFDAAAGVSSTRLTGAATITTGFTMNGIRSNNGDISIKIMDGTGLTGASALSGDITIARVSSNMGEIANNLEVINDGPTAGQKVKINGAISVAGTVLITTRDGDINLAGNISTLNGTANAIKLIAGTAFAAPVDTGGNIVISGTRTLTTGAGGRVSLFSGSSGASTGVAALATASRSFNNVDPANMPSSGVSTGIYAFFRQNIIPLTLTLANTTKVYGDANPALPAYTLTSGAFNAGDTISAMDWGSAATQFKAQGTYAYSTANLLNPTFSCAVAGCASVYSLTFVNGLTITPRPITVTADPKSMSYGGVAPALTYQITSGNMVNSDALSGALTRTAGMHAGTYPIAIGTLAASSNYAVTYAPANFVIDRAVLTVSMTNTGVTKTYDGTYTAPVGFTPAFSVAGLVSGDTASIFYSAAGFNDPHVLTANKVTASPLSITSISGTNGSLVSDYVLSATSAFVPATITPKALTATASIVGTLSKTYDGTTAATGASVSGTVSGEVAGDSLSLNTSSVTLAFNNAHAVNASTISASGAPSLVIGGSSHGSLLSDYSFTAPTVADVAGTITPKALTATASIGGTLSKTYDGTTDATGASVSGSVSGAIAGDSLTLDTSGVALAYVGIEGPSMIRASGLSRLRIDQTLAASVASDYSFTAPVVADVVGEIGRKPSQNSPIPPAPQSNAVNASVDLNVEMKKEKVVAVADVIASAKVATEVPQMKIAATLSFGAADSLGMELVVSSNAASLTTVDAGPAKAGNAEDTEVKTNSVALFNQTGDKVAAGGALSIVEQGKNMRASVTTADTAQSLNVNLAGMRFVNVDFKLPSGAPNQLSVGVSADGMLVVKVPPAMKASSDDRSLALIGMATAKERLDVQPSSVKGVVIQVE